MEDDQSRPHPGRMYDYVIGGTHNSEIDRAAAEQFIALVPSIRATALENRAFLKVVARRWAEAGLDRVLDLGSGLPTQDHFNSTMPDARVLYVDRDPMTVEDGRRLLDGRPGHSYLQQDVTETRALAHAVQTTFGDRPRLAVSLVGVSYFLSDDEVRRLSRSLASMCAPGSAFAMTFLEALDADTAVALVDEYARVARAEFYLRSPDEIADLLGPWQIDDSRPVEGYRSDDEDGLSQENDGLRMYGVFASNP